MEETEKSTLCTQLGTVDTSIFFLLLILLSLILSLRAIFIQRGQLACTIAGAAEAAPPVYPIRRTAAALVVGSLGFFLCLAIRGARDAEAGQDCVAKRSAKVNVWASIFVLVAALLRLDDLDFVACSRQQTPAADQVLPD